MRTLKLMIMVLLMGTTISINYSQKQHGKFDRKAKQEDRINKMDEIVKFTGDQRAQVEALFDDMAKKRRDAFCANELGSDGMQKAMKDIRKDKMEGLKKILTKDQQKLWKNYVKTNKPEKKGDGKHEKKGKTLDDRINTQLDKMNEVVKFTGSQRDDLKKLFTDLGKRGKDAICNNEPGSDAFKAAMKTIREDKKEGIRKILSEDQMKLWKEHKKTKRDNHKKGDDDNDPNNRIDKEK